MGDMSTLVYLRGQLTIPGESLSDFGQQWRSLTSEDRKELTALARKEMDADRLGG